MLQQEREILYQKDWLIKLQIQHMKGVADHTTQVALSSHLSPLGLFDILPKHLMVRIVNYCSLELQVNLRHVCRWF